MVQGGRFKLCSISVGETRASSNLVQCNIIFWLLIPFLSPILPGNLFTVRRNRDYRNADDGGDPRYEGLQVLQTNFVYALDLSVLRQVLIQNLHN